MQDSHQTIKLVDFIHTANMPQLGSYGEAVYEESMLANGASIKRLHVGRADFEVNGDRVDVKTSRQNFHKLLERPHFKFRNPLPETRYAILEFNMAGALLSEGGEIIAQIGWPFLESVYGKWRQGGFSKPHQLRVNPKRPLSLDLVEKTKQLFLEIGLQKPYQLYRTVMFDKESPHNLLPTQRKAKDQCGFTVFYVFHKAPPEESNLKEIIAFPDRIDPELPRLKKLRTSSHIQNLEKADIELFPAKFRFRSFEDFAFAVRGLYMCR